MKLSISILPLLFALPASIAGHSSLRTRQTRQNGEEPSDVLLSPSDIHPASNNTSTEVHSHADRRLQDQSLRIDNMPGTLDGKIGGYLNPTLLPPIMAPAGYFACGAQVHQKTVSERFFEIVGRSVRYDPVTSVAFIFCSYAKWDDQVILDYGNPSGTVGERVMCPRHSFIKGGKGIFMSFETFLRAGGFDADRHTKVYAYTGMYILCDTPEFNNEIGRSVKALPHRPHIDYVSGLTKRFLSERFMNGFQLRFKPKSGGAAEEGVFTEIRMIGEQPPRTSKAPVEGFWEAGTSGPTVTKSLTISSTTTDSTTVTTTQSHEFTKSISAGFGFKGFTADVSVSSTQASSVSEAVQSTFSVTKSETVSVSCGDTSDSSTGVFQLYQWNMKQSADSNGVGFSIQTKHYRCTESVLQKPRCPLGFCADRFCQTCREPFQELSQAPAPTPQTPTALAPSPIPAPIPLPDSQGNFCPSRKALEQCKRYPNSTRRTSSSQCNELKDDDGNPLCFWKNSRCWPKSPADPTDETIVDDLTYYHSCINWCPGDLSLTGAAPPWDPIKKCKSFGKNKCKSAGERDWCTYCNGRCLPGKADAVCDDDELWSKKQCDESAGQAPAPTPQTPTGPAPTPIPAPIPSPDSSADFCPSRKALEQCKRYPNSTRRTSSSQCNELKDDDGTPLCFWKNSRCWPKSPADPTDETIVDDLTYYHSCINWCPGDPSLTGATPPWDPTEKCKSFGKNKCKSSGERDWCTYCNGRCRPGKADAVCDDPNLWTEKGC